MFVGWRHLDQADIDRHDAGSKEVRDVTKKDRYEVGVSFVNGGTDRIAHEEAVDMKSVGVFRFRHLNVTLDSDKDQFNTGEIWRFLGELVQEEVRRLCTPLYKNAVTTFDFRKGFVWRDVLDFFFHLIAN